MKKLDGETETTDGLLLLSETKAPLGPAGDTRLTWNAAVFPRPSVTAEGRIIWL
jgi:hypothetical protein